MAKPYTIPKLAMAMNEGTISQWVAAEGDYINQGDPICVIETEKVAYEVESPESGFLHIIVAEGETVPIDTLVGQFAEDEAELKTLQQGHVPELIKDGKPNIDEVQQITTEPQTTSLDIPSNSDIEIRIKASPLARRLAKDKGLDLRLIMGTGPAGRIVKRDIEEILNKRTAIAVTSTVNLASTEKARIPIKGIRKTIADRMMQSLQQSAQLSASWESDITNLLAFRKRLVARETQLGTRISVNTLIIKAIASAIRDVPIANSCIEGDEIVIYDSVNMGIAIALPGQTEFDSALAVGVLRAVEKKGLAQLDQEMKALVERVRNGKASAEDQSGSTITLSSTAGIAPPGMTTTPILNLPNAMLVGPSTPIERPIVIDGEICLRTVMPINITFDHRGIDGEMAAHFMSALHNYLETPELMLS